MQYEEADKESVSFKELLEDVKLSSKTLIEAYNACIYDDFSLAPAIVFSRKNLRSIIYNLVSNAIKYSSPDRSPEIHITTVVVEGYTRFSVQDNGLGLRQQDQQKVFGMFRRLHAHVEGTGVGLAIVKRIVENCDGKIEFESELGKGSVFHVYLK